MPLSTLALTLRNPKRRVERDPRFGRKLTSVELEMFAAVEVTVSKHERHRQDSDAARKGQR